MKCICPNCRLKLLINRKQLTSTNRKSFHCPSCKSLIKVKPSQAKCGNCNIRFGYYDYQFEKEKPLVQCHQCKAINRLKLSY